MTYISGSHKRQAACATFDEGPLMAQSGRSFANSQRRRSVQDLDTAPIDTSEGVVLLLVLDPNSHPWFKAFRLLLRVEAQLKRVAVMIANHPLGLPGGEGSDWM